MKTELQKQQISFCKHSKFLIKMSTINAVNTKRVWIVVLGDIGRSPRMQNHVKSFAENGYLVEVIGYVESRVNQVKK